MRNILFTGCSYVEGTGLEHEYNNLGHFSKILVNNLFGDQHSIDNIGKCGHSNERIFLDSLDALTKKNYDFNLFTLMLFKLSTARIVDL